MRRDDAGGFDLRRRQALSLLGVSAAAGVAARLGWLDELSVVLPAQAPAGGAKIPVPAGGIIRTITGDIDPNSYTGGTLMHEHRGNGRPAQARGGGGPLPVDNPTQDAAWMAEELTLARKNGNLACIVAAGLNIPSADNAAYLTKLSQASGVRIVAAAAYYNPQSYPAGTDKLTEDGIADLIVKGAGTSIRVPLAFGQPVGVHTGAVDNFPSHVARGRRGMLRLEHVPAPDVRRDALLHPLILDFPGDTTRGASPGSTTSTRVWASSMT